MKINSNKLIISAHARERALQRYNIVVDRVFVDFIYSYLESLNIKPLLINNPSRLKVNYADKKIYFVVTLKEKTMKYSIITFLPKE